MDIYSKRGAVDWLRRVIDTVVFVHIYDLRNADLMNVSEQTVDMPLTIALLD